jgi:hypothetical protein
MDKAGPTNARPAANIGMLAAENPCKCRHSKWSVIRQRLPSADHGREESRPSSRKLQWKQPDKWLSDGNANGPDMKQIGCNTLPFGFA